MPDLSGPSDAGGKQLVIRQVTPEIRTFQKPLIRPDILNYT